MQNGVGVRLLCLVAARQLRWAFGCKRRFGLVRVDFETAAARQALSAGAYATSSQATLTCNLKPRRPPKCAASAEVLMAQRHRLNSPLEPD